MLTKVCVKCRCAKATEFFYVNKRMKDGLNTFCISCHKADNIARKAKNRKDPAFKAAENSYKKTYRDQTVDQRAEYMKKWREKNQQSALAYGRAYRHANKAKYNFLTQKRKLDLICRTPKWLTQDDLWMMAETYKLAELRSNLLGFKWHVDHIIPLRGRSVSGLHVPQNLRVIPGIENMRKTNKYEM